jgi:hypothetical protein
MHRRLGRGFWESHGQETGTYTESGHRKDLTSTATDVAPSKEATAHGRSGTTERSTHEERGGERGWTSLERETHTDGAEVCIERNGL